MTAHLDIETASQKELQLRRKGGGGVYPYAQHPTTQVLCVAYAVSNDSPVKLWRPGDMPPEDLFEAIRTGSLCVAHNVEFDAEIWKEILTPRYSWWWPGYDAFACSAARAALLNLPRPLEAVGDAVGLKMKKDKEGYKLMMKLCKPARLTKNLSNMWRHHLPEDLRKLELYCRDDVKAERELASVLKKPSAFEEKVRLATHKMNARGFNVNLQRVENMMSIAALIQDKKRTQLVQLTDHAVERETQGARFIDWLKSRNITVPVKENKNGQEVPTADKEAVDTMLSYDDLPADIRAALEIKKQLNKSSLGKLAKIMDMVCPDGRVRGVHAYAGAEMTARWSGRGVQCQNLPRGLFKTTAEYDLALGFIDTLNIDDLCFFFDEEKIMDVISSCIRACIIPSDGNELVVSDYSAIEGRVVMWLAGQTDLLNAYKNGLDLYKVVAATRFGIPYEKVNSKQRQLGKVLVLACNYQMWAEKFMNTAAGYGIEMEEADARREVLKYRDMIPKVVAYWKGLEKAAKEALRSPGRVTRCRSIKFQVKKGVLLCRLPSGRCLHYNKARLRVRKVEIKTKDGGVKLIEREAITYFMVRDGQSMWVDTYGGKLCENITQAVSRDLMAGAIVRAEDRGYDPVLTVHDELACDQPIGVLSVEELNACMIEQEPWADGLPLDAEGWSGQYYRK